MTQDEARIEAAAREEIYAAERGLVAEMRRADPGFRLPALPIGHPRLLEVQAAPPGGPLLRAGRRRC